MAQRICVTGAIGLAGRAVVRELLEHGYDVAATDVAARHDIEAEEGVLRADLTDYGQAIKVATETIAGHFAQWSGIPFVALRFSNIMSPEWYEEFPSYWPDPQLRKWNLWGYIDERDVALSCRLALEAPREAVAGNPAFIIAAADTVMNRPSAALLAEVFPGVELRREVGEFGTLLAIDRAQQVLGFEPHHSWRDHVSADAAP